MSDHRDDPTPDDETTAAPAPAPVPARRTLLRKLAVAGSAAVVAVGVGLGIAGVGTGGSDATATAANAPSGAAQGAPPRGTAPAGTRGQRGGPDLTELATALGVSEAKLQAAFEAGRTAPGTGGARPSTTTLAADLAKRLGLDEATVTKALAAHLMTPPPAGAAS